MKTMSPERIVVVGLGANVGDARRTMADALDAVAAIEGVCEVARSHSYLTTPVGGPPQPDYVNAAIALRTALPAHAILDALLAIERRFGRVRGPERNEPRTLDLDLLWIEGESLAEPDLVVPHPRLAERAFALVPFVEIVPGARDSAGVPYAAHLARIGTAGVRPLGRQASRESS